MYKIGRFLQGTGLLIVFINLVYIFSYPHTIQMGAEFALFGVGGGLFLIGRGFEGRAAKK